MSLFDGIPADFPLDIDLTRRPVSYSLRIDTADRIVVTILSVFWLIFGSVGVPVLVWEFAGLVGLPAGFDNVAALVVAVVYLIGFGGWWFWPQINGAFHTVNVTIPDRQVDVATRKLTGSESWSLPIADFKGVALLNLGTHTVGEQKLPIASVVLKHPDPARSVPVAINAAARIGQKTVVRKAAQLGLSVLEGVGDESGETAYPPGTIIVNRYQALKVRALYWLFVAVAAVFVAGTIYQMAVGAADPVWPILAAVFVAVALAMHVYMMRYVVDLGMHDGQVWLRSAALVFRIHRVVLDQIYELGHSEGRRDIGRHSTHTPWIKMRIHGYFLPFIIDMQSDYVDEKKLQQMRAGLRLHHN